MESLIGSAHTVEVYKHDKEHDHYWLSHGNVPNLTAVLKEV